jgi:hypothetical protein
VSTGSFIKSDVTVLVWHFIHRARKEGEQELLDQLIEFQYQLHPDFIDGHVEEMVENRYQQEFGTAKPKPLTKPLKRPTKKRVVVVRRKS